MFEPLTQVLILLAGSVFLVTLARRLGLPAALAYLVVGLVLGPHALGVMSDSGTTRLLADKILRDDGATSNLTVTEEEVNRLFSK